MLLDSLAPLPLSIKTPLADALQTEVQSELAARSWAPPDDAVMAEYTVLMAANGKTGAQVAEELRDLIGPHDFDPQFVVWLWNTAATLLQGAPVPPQPEPVVPPATSAFASHRDRSRSRSPGRRLPSPRGHFGGGRAEMEQSFRNRPVRPQKELFEAAVQDAVSSPQSRGRGRRVGRMDIDPDDEMSHVLDLNKSERDANFQQRAALRGARAKGELFPNASPRDVRIRGRAGKKTEPDPTKPSIFARTSTPNPNMPSFVPNDQLQGDDVMDVTADTTDAPASLLARLGPRQPSSGAVPSGSSALDINSVDVRQFPWEPSKEESCRFGLRCTNPMCAYSHSTPVLANSPKEGDALMLSTEHCPAGPKCRNRECTLSHCSPAVSVLASRAQAAARAQMARARLIAATGPSSAGSAPRPCRFQQACTNAQCTFTHFDASGTPTPPPARLASALEDAAAARPAPTSAPSQPAGSERPQPAIDLDKPLDDAASVTKPCRYGINCTRAGCFFTHPPQRVVPQPGGAWANRPKGAAAWLNPNQSTTFDASGAPQARPFVSCKFGAQCYRANCAFSHPPERQVPGAGTKLATSDRLAAFSLERDPNDVERIIPST